MKLDVVYPGCDSIYKYHGMMRYILFCLCFLISSNCFSQVDSDGPYVYYTLDGSIVVREVKNGVADLKTYEGRLKSKIDLNVIGSGGGRSGFSVRLFNALQVPPSEYSMPGKMLVLSDIEGEFEGLCGLLIGNGVMDKAFNWTFGKGHLVVCGDLFDRGKQVPEVLWLLYRLEYLANDQGGKVHVILGNHDIMNLSGDLRYVDRKYFESAKLMKVDYMSLYADDTELGRWLRSKNTIEKIGNALYLHAGIAPQINKLGMTLDGINAKCRPFYDKAKLLNGVGDPKLDGFFNGKTSLFWYRGYFAEPKATEAEVDETLKLYGVDRIVVGHTIVPGNVGLYYNGKVLGIDVNQHEGDHQAAYYEKGKWWKVDDRGQRVELTL